MHHATFQFHGSLRDFLADAPGNPTSVRYLFPNKPSIKDAIEAIGPPHTEVAVIIVNGAAVGFNYLLQNHDLVDVYGHEQHPPVSGEYTLPNLPDKEPWFILDVHLGNLARYLRLLGFDTLYRTKDPGDKAIADIAKQTQRIVLTRDIGLLKRAVISYGHWIRNTYPKKQLREVIDRYQLQALFSPFTRCMHCNGLIQPIEKSQIQRRIKEGIQRDYNAFWLCTECKNVYWKGSHYDKLDAFVKKLCKNAE
jgi:uncharacterized protein with PIN domain